MPKKRKPSYLLHKPTGQSRIRIDGKDIYLGPYDSPESRERYDDLISEWIARNADVSRYALTVDDLALLFLSDAETYYRNPNGEPTGEATSIRHALRPLVEMYGTLRVRDFGPKKLKRVRAELIRRKHCRTNINRMVDRIRRMFRWGVSEEYVPAHIPEALKSVKRLSKGRTDAIESKPVEKVAEDVVEATLPHLPKTLATMVRLQLLTGARPGEICSLRPCDVTFGVDGVWRYTPESHKTLWRGKQRRIHIGPKGQEVLHPFLERPPDAYCFSPAESEAQRIAMRREYRKSPMTPSQASRKRQKDRSRPPAERYTKDSYCRAIKRACEIAFGMPKELRSFPKTLPDRERRQLQKAAAEWRAEHCWTPGQLRHTRGTAIRKEYGIEASQVVLGHSDPKTTEIYAEKDFSLAAKVMLETG